MTRRSARTRGTRSFLPTPRDRALLTAVRTHTRLTSGQLRRLFFRRGQGVLAAPQTVNARLRKLMDAGYLDVVVVDRGRGSGPYAYGLGPRAFSLIAGLRGRRPSSSPGPVLHQIEVAELRVRLDEELRATGGELVDWIGERDLRVLAAGHRAWPVPDALVHWRLDRREGVFCLEWDRGSEPLATLTAKLLRYRVFWRERGYRYWLPGLGLKPRLAVVTASRRFPRLGRHLAALRTPLDGTVCVTSPEHLRSGVLDALWWRSDRKREGSVFS